MQILYINEQSVGRMNLWSRSARLCLHATLRISPRYVDLIRRQNLWKSENLWFFLKKSKCRFSQKCFTNRLLPSHSTRGNRHRFWCFGSFLRSKSRRFVIEKIDSSLLWHRIWSASQIMKILKFSSKNAKLQNDESIFSMTERRLLDRRRPLKHRKRCSLLPWVLWDGSNRLVEHFWENQNFDFFDEKNKIFRFSCFSISEPDPCSYGWSSN